MAKPRNKLIKCDPFTFEQDFADENIKMWEAIHGYQCEECKETFASIEKKTEKKIPTDCGCGGRLRHFILGDTQNFINNITTVGQLAERNTKRMGTYELQEKRQAVKDNKKLAKELIRQQSKLKQPRLETSDNPEEYKKLKKIAKMTPTQKQNYIETGNE